MPALNLTGSGPKAIPASQNPTRGLANSLFSGPKEATATDPSEKSRTRNQNRGSSRRDKRKTESQTRCSHYCSYCYRRLPRPIHNQTLVSRRGTGARSSHGGPRKPHFPSRRNVRGVENPQNWAALRKVPNHLRQRQPTQLASLRTNQTRPMAR